MASDNKELDGRIPLAYELNKYKRIEKAKKLKRKIDKLSARNRVLKRK